MSGFSENGDRWFVCSSDDVSSIDGGVSISLDDPNKGVIFTRDEVDEVFALGRALVLWARINGASLPQAFPLWKTDGVTEAESSWLDRFARAVSDGAENLDEICHVPPRIRGVIAAMLNHFPSIPAIGITPSSSPVVDWNDPVAVGKFLRLMKRAMDSEDWQGDEAP